MKPYQGSRSLHAAGAAGALVLTLATLGIAVVLPMHVDAPLPQPIATSAPHVGAPAQAEAVVARFRIDVIASRKAKPA